MVSPLLILIAALLTGAAVALAARVARWPAVPLALVSVGASIAVLGWRLMSNLWGLNDDFMPAVSVGDVVCLAAGGLPPALVAAARRRLVPGGGVVAVVAVGAVVAFVVNVGIL